MKVNDLAKVHIVFENCESIEVPAEDVRYFYATGITENIRFNNILRKNNVRKEYDKSAEYFRITVTDKEDYRRILEWNDITQIHMYDSEDNHDWFFVYWDGDDYDNGQYQKSELHRGDIHVTVSKEVPSE